MKYKVQIERLAGRYVVALKDPDTGDLVKAMAVNITAAEMIRGLADGMTDEDLVRNLSERFSADEKTVSRDLKSLKEKLSI